MTESLYGQVFKNVYKVLGYYKIMNQVGMRTEHKLFDTICWFVWDERYQRWMRSPAFNNIAEDSLMNGNNRKIKEMNSDYVDLLTMCGNNNPTLEGD